VLTYLSLSSAKFLWATQAVSEKLSLKEKIFAELTTELSPEAILATNTSSISITKIAAAAIPQGTTAASEEGKASTGRVVGLHFFNPVPVMVCYTWYLLPFLLTRHQKLVELISALQTKKETLDRARSYAIACGKG
jgi:3-hydroxybutyryl-CoA dehydrogenase